MAVAGGAAAIGPAGQDLGQARIERQRDAFGHRRFGPGQGARGVAQPHRVSRARRRALGGGGAKQAADLQLDRQIGGRLLAGVGLDVQNVQPGGRVIDPALERVVPDAQAIEHEGGAPAVVHHRGQAHLAPRALLLVAVEQGPAQEIVAIGDQVDLDHEALAHDALDRMGAGIDLRPHALHPYAFVAFVWRRFLFHCPMPAMGVVSSV